MLAGWASSSPRAQSSDPCAPPNGNPIKCENTLTGNPQSEWDIVGAGDSTIQGFATDISVNQGQTIQFKVDTNATAYRIDIYRLGYYAGLGARKVATVSPSVTLPQTQPACVNDIPTGLTDCGNWTVSASWSVPSTAVSGVYIARLVRTDTGGASHIPFVVRNDTGNSAILFQTSDTTWQAYNNYGGNSLYVGNPVGRAYKVSYNRPFVTRGWSVTNSVFWGEFPMIRWLEANGYDVSYASGVDTDRRGSELTKHKVFLSVGHDEYWSGAQRAAVEAARDAGVNLGFFSGNSVFWKTRWENSIAGTSTPYRTLVCYKETHANAKIDPTSEWTGTWRDPRFSPPADGGRPENGLLGAIFTVDGQTGNDGVALQVPAAFGGLRFWRNTSIASLTAGQVATLPNNTVGYEWDEDLDNGFRPAGAIRMSSTTASVQYKLLDYGTNYGPGTATHALMLYKAPSGALVFDTATVQWSFGLDSVHDGPVVTPDVRMRQATVNILADMGMQPLTLQSGLVAASKSADTASPYASITSPSAGQHLTQSTISVSGTAADTGGGVVAGVEVSTDGGVTWHPASGTTAWSYSWTPGASGTYTIAARATDDSGNMQSVPAALSVSVTLTACSANCTIWSSSAAPTLVDGGADNPVDVGVKFQTSANGAISGVRFYKASANTGTHVGSLWTSGGTLLAQATFTGESTSGWQQVNFSSAVTVTPGTTYVASYHTTGGHYSFDQGYFGSTGVTNGPLQALANGTSGVNGVFSYGSGSTFPINGFNSFNPWVDVVFQPGAADTTPPTISGVSAGSISSSAATITWTTNESADSQVDYGLTSSYGSSSALQSTLVTSHSVALSGLTSNTTYHYRVKSRDAAGNLATSGDFSFKTSTSSTCSANCSIWSSSATPTVLDGGPDNPVELGLKFQATAAGSISGVRFYKSAANTGTHVGSLWTTTGTLLAQATFSGETSSGWQQVSFSAPVAIAAGTTYIVSYHINAGHYSLDQNYFASTGVTNGALQALANGVSGANGVFGYGSGSTFPTSAFNAFNAWVDVVYQPGGSDTTPPTISSVQTNSITSSTANVTWTTNEAADSQVDYGVTTSYGQTSTLQSSLVTSHTVALSGLSPSTTYDFRVRSRDAAGNLALSSNGTFTTSAATSCTACTLFSTSTVPVLADAGADSPVEIGMKFTSNVSGQITGARFYKASANTGTHVASLWSSTGTLLARATFSGETSSGWQQVTFSSPVSITANTVYVISYHSTVGHYSLDQNYFTSAKTNGPLTAPADGGSAGSNSVFVYSASSAFPTSGFSAFNGYVDVVFKTP